MITEKVDKNVLYVYCISPDLNNIFKISHQKKLFFLSGPATKPSPPTSLVVTFFSIFFELQKSYFSMWPDLNR